MLKMVMGIRHPEVSLHLPLICLTYVFMIMILMFNVLSLNLVAATQCSELTVSFQSPEKSH